MSDLRYAIRQLVKNPGFTLVSVIMLSLGIGANTAIFSMVNTVLLKPLPYPDAPRLVMVCENNKSLGWKQSVSSTANYRDWKAQNTTFEEMAAVRFDNFNISQVDNPERLMGAQVGDGFFKVFQVPPLLGRTFLPEEHSLNARRVVVISEALWRRKFGADTNIVGKAATFNGGLHTIVGVMPASFQFFHPTTVEGWPAGLQEAELWRPFYLNQEQLEDRGDHWLLVVGRLKQNITLAQAQSDIGNIVERIHGAHPGYSGWGATVVSLHAQAVAKIRPALLALFGSVICVLLIVCANLASLLLARANDRHKEFAIRAALGAGNLRIFQQLLMEGLLLATLGGLGGLVLAHWGMAVLCTLAPVNIPRLGDVHLDGQVLAATGLICLATGLIFGFSPMIGSARIKLNQFLNEGGRSGTPGTRQNRFRGLLAVGQVALALVLLTSAGLLGRSFWNLIRVDPGFQAEKLVAVDISLVDRKYGTPAKRIVFVSRLLEELKTAPGIESVATIYGLPLGSTLYGTFSFNKQGQETAPNKLQVADVRQISDDYFATMGIPILKGRAFNNTDGTNSPPVVIVNETLAQKYFPGESPLGKQIVLGDGEKNPAEIVGITRDTKPLGLDLPTPPEAFRSHNQCCDWYLSVVVRSSGSPESTINLLRDRVRAVDPDRSIYNIRTMPHAISESLSTRRFAMQLIFAFALTALVLAALGLYGLIAYSVSQRTKEVGIRMALGAQQSDVITMILRQGLALVGAGMLAGLAGAWATSHLLANQLFGVTGFDPATIGVVSGTLFIVAFGACFLPARRAARVDPMIALRHE